MRWPNNKKKREKVTGWNRDSIARGGYDKKRDIEEKELQRNNNIPLVCYESILFHFISLPHSCSRLRMAKSISFQYVWIAYIREYIFLSAFGWMFFFCFSNFDAHIPCSPHTHTHMPNIFRFLPLAFRFSSVVAAK